METREKQPLLGMTPDEMQTAVITLGMPAFTAKQIALASMR